MRLLVSTPWKVNHFPRPSICYPDAWRKKCKRNWHEFHAFLAHSIFTLQERFDYIMFTLHSVVKHDNLMVFAISQTQEQIAQKLATRIKMMFYLVCIKSHSKTVPHYGTYINLFRQIIKLQCQTEYHNGGCCHNKKIDCSTNMASRNSGTISVYWWND